MIQIKESQKPIDNKEKIVLAECPGCTSTQSGNYNEDEEFNIKCVSSMAEMAPNTSRVISIESGRGPYTWVVQGTGFSLKNSQTAGATNVLYASGSSCGTARVTVTDNYGGKCIVSARGSAGGWKNLGKLTYGLYCANTNMPYNGREYYCFDKKGYYHFTREQYYIKCGTPGYIEIGCTCCDDDSGCPLLYCQECQATKGIKPCVTTTQRIWVCPGE